VILDKLGEGGRGVVYKALDTVLDRVVAIKLLKAEGLDEEAFTRFGREAQAAARLTHANIVATYDLGQEDGRPFLVMEYIDGASLQRFLERGPEGRLDLSTLLRLARDICGALEDAHSHSVLHRDIKPENVIVTKDGTAKLMDFGLALALDKPRVTPSGTMVGTPAYMSPENALGKASDARSDLYSLGAVLYEMATGHPPFSQDDSLKVIYSHIHDTPVLPSRINSDVVSGLEDVILRLLEKDPAGRYQSASDVLLALQEVQESLAGRWEEAGAELAPEETPAARRAPTPESRRALALIDRETELEAVRGFVDRAIRGDGSVVFLSGEAGVGKTRLGEEVKAYATLRGTRWLQGRCFEREGSAPYTPWIEMLREFVREAPRQLLYKVSGSYAAELAKLVPEVVEKVGPAPPVALGHPEQERLRLFEAVTQLCLNLSREAPLVLFLDDLNWADPPSLELLHYVARRVPGNFFMILGAYRDIEVAEDSPLSQLLFNLNRERFLHQISLPRFDPAHVARMITETFGDEEVSAEFRDLVYEKTGGNPFFVEEVLRSLVEEGVMYKTEDRWDRRPISEIRIPSSVRTVVRQRLNRLDDDCNQVLALASVIGKEFPFGVLQQVSGLDEDRLLTLLEAALRARLIEEKPLAPGRSVFLFSDSQVRDVLYDGLSLIRRRRHHLKVAHALEKASKGEEDRQAAVLAYHYVRGDDVEKALDYSVRAGERASKVYAHEEAIRNLSVALELMEEEGDPTLHVQILEQLGDESSYLGDADAALGYWTKAAGIYEDLAQKLPLGEVLRKVGYAHFMEKYDQGKALEFYTRARTILEEQPPGVELARLYHDIGRLHWRSGEDPSTAISMCERALQLAEELGAHEVESHAYQTLAFL
ncbi:MAG: protein kinase, partial [Thermoplasmata archaeon]